MNTRYQRIYALPENIYAKGAPVILVAGVLLYDNVKDRMVIQMKLKNISDKRIRATIVSFVIYDEEGIALNEIISHGYEMDANVDSYFGDRIAVQLPSKNSTSFSVIALDVAFQNGEVWSSATDEKFFLIKRPKTLDDALCENELIEQFIENTNEKAKYFPKISDSYWICSCGEIHEKGTESCQNCNINLAQLIKNMDINKLRDDFEERKHKEQKELEIRRKKKRKTLLMCIAVIVFLVVVIWITLPWMLEKRLINLAKSKTVNLMKERARNISEEMFYSDEETDYIVRNLDVNFNPVERIEDGVTLSGKVIFTFPSGDVRESTFSIDFDMKEWNNMSIVEKLRFEYE